VSGPGASDAGPQSIGRVGPPVAGDPAATGATPRGDTGDFRRQAMGGIVVLALSALLLPLTWPILTFPKHSIDVAWAVGLQQAAADGLAHGRDIAWTYGPLGFLGRPTPFVGATSATALLVTAAIYLAALASLLHATRRHFGLAVAVIVALLAGRAFAFIEPFETLLNVVFAWAVELLRRDPVRRPDWVAVTAGVLSGAAMLGKLNDGVFVTAMSVAVVAAVSPRRVRSLAILGIAFATTFLVLWTATGQGAADLAGYVRASLDLISGYSDAMGAYRPAYNWMYLAFGVTGILVLWAAWNAGAGSTRLRRLALAGIVVLLLFATWKFAFVRNHVAASFATLGFAGLMLVSTRLPRSTVLVTVAALAIAFLGVSSVQPVRLAGVVDSARAFASQALTAGSPSRWEAATRETRDHLRDFLRLPPSLLPEVEGRTTHVDPWYADAITAYPGMTWRPPPVFQTYSAYTVYLDELNADLLRSEGRPQRILRHGTPEVAEEGARVNAASIDSRFYWWDSPAATVERVCRYEEIAADAGWQVLADTGRACGPLRPLGSATAAHGQPVPVPAAPDAGDLVIVRIHGLEPDLPSRVRSALWRTPPWYADLDGVRYRIVPGTATQTLLLAVPTPAQGSPDWAFGPPVRTLSIHPMGSAGGGHLSYEFFAMRHPGT
jgi:hypothetical protein